MDIANRFASSVKIGLHQNENKTLRLACMEAVRSCTNLKYQEKRDFFEISAHRIVA